MPLIYSICPRCELSSPNHILISPTILSCVRCGTLIPIGVTPTPSLIPKISGGVNNIIADVWQSFEFASLTTGNLDASDHYGPTGAWSIVDLSTRLSMGVSASQVLKSTISGITDTPDTEGLIYDANSASKPSYCRFNFPVAKLSISFGFWFNCPAGIVGTFTEDDIFQMDTTLGNKNIYIKLSDQQNGTGQGTRIHIFNPVDLYSTGILVSPATWYWVTISYADSFAAGMKLRVYDVNGVQVGVENTRSTASDSGGTNCKIGSQIGNASAFVGNMLYDDLLIDFTNFIFPLGP